MWTSADEYLEREQDKYERALDLINIYKESNDDDLQFIANYLEDILKENSNLDKRETEYFKKSNLFEYERDCYKNYSKALELQLKDRIGYVNYLKEKFKINKIEGE